jgi:hypothetical protein
VARGEQAPERGLLAREALAERAAERREARKLGLRRALLGLESAQRAGGLRNGALGVAQRVACFAPVGFLVAEPGLERLDPRAQRRQVLIASRVRPAERTGGDRKPDEERAPQARALPCAETAATRRSISAASPR